MILIFSHKLSKEQIEDAKNSLKVDEFISLEPPLQKIWSNIPPEVEDITPLLKTLKDFIAKNGKKGDFVLIQGDQGAVVKMIYFARAKGMIPIYSTTKREVIEEKSGEKIKKISLFKHIRFRKY